MVECMTVARKTRVRFPPSALNISSASLNNINSNLNIGDKK